jgi:hypothetical protein
VKYGFIAEAERGHRRNDLGPFGECGVDEVESIDTYFSLL